MKKNATILAIIVCCGVFSPASGQTDLKSATRNPVILSLYFHGLSLPFRQLKSTLSNFGIGVGTELNYNSSGSMRQKFNLVWFHNKAAGNGMTAYSQLAWMPDLGSSVQPEIMGGMGYLYAFRPGGAWQQLNGEWRRARKGKGMLCVPAGIAVALPGYDSKDIKYTPFAGYQFLILKGYSSSIPLMPAQLIQAGVKINSLNK